VPATEWGYLATPEEFERWIIHEDDRLLVVNKPGGLVCHPSKHGPWSSLIGAAREYLGLSRLHMPSRLDRETSGAVVFAKTSEAASPLQTAIERGRVRKRYLAVLEGRLEAPVEVDQPLGPVPGAAVWCRQGVRPEGRASRTTFEPLHSSGPFTVARVIPHTGRMHQIRAHAAWLGHPVVGDKIYGPDERLFLEFIRTGISGSMLAVLKLPRHALHAAEIEFPGLPPFQTGWPDDLAGFCRDHALDWTGCEAHRT